MRLLDANLIVRAVADDHPEMSEAARALFRQIQSGEDDVLLLEATVAEVVYVLGSRATYGQSREWIVERLTWLLAMPGIRMEHKARCAQALQMFVSIRAVSFADALIAAAALEQTPSEVYSFDRGFDRIDGLTRIEPVAP